MINANPTFSVGSEVAQNGLFKITVNAQYVPANLFGVSFHLKVSGDSWSYKTVETGDVFAADPMVLAQQSGDVLVVGVSLRRGDVLQARDGELVSFYVGGQSEIGQISFENSVASVFENGRKDLENVIWLGSGENVLAEVDKAEGVIGGDDVVKEFVGEPSFRLQGESGSVDVASRFEDGQVSTLQMDNTLVDIYLFLGFTFLLMVIVFGGWLVFKYKYEIRSVFGKNR